MQLAPDKQQSVAVTKHSSGFSHRCKTCRHQWPSITICTQSWNTEWMCECDLCFIVRRQQMYFAFESFAFESFVKNRGRYSKCVMCNYITKSQHKTHTQECGSAWMSCLCDFYWLVPFTKPFTHLSLWSGMTRLMNFFLTKPFWSLPCSASQNNCTVFKALFSCWIIYFYEHT